MAKAISPQQMSFAVNAASGMSLTDAALAAGYSPNTAKYQGSHLARQPHIAAEIDRIAKKGEAVAMGSKAQVLDLVWQTMEGAFDDGDRTNVYKGAELWLKATGQLVDKQQIEQTTRTIEIDWSASGGGDE